MSGLVYTTLDIVISSMLFLLVCVFIVLCVCVCLCTRVHLHAKAPVELRGKAAGVSSLLLPHGPL